MPFSISGVRFCVPGLSSCTCQDAIGTDHFFHFMQDLLEVHMGMQLDQMQRLAQLTPASRVLKNLPGAHMPARGFYRIKVTASQVCRDSTSCLKFWSTRWFLRTPQASASQIC